MEKCNVGMPILDKNMKKIISIDEKCVGHSHTECLFLHQASSHLLLRKEHCHRQVEEPK